MNTRLQTSILESLEQLDEQHQEQVLRYAQALAQQHRGSAKVEWKHANPAVDWAAFIGSLPAGEDGVAYQRRLRDAEWA